MDYEWRIKVAEMELEYLRMELEHMRKRQALHHQDAHDQSNYAVALGDRMDRVEADLEKTAADLAETAATLKETNAAVQAIEKQLANLIAVLYESRKD
jgi:hypothetical protein